MKRIKRGLVLLMVSVLVLGSVGCSDSQSPSSDTAKEGKIVVAVPFGGQAAAIWEKIADEYTAINPDVTVEIQDKEASSYFDWLGNELAGGTLSADIVQNNQANQYFSENKFVDFNQYLTKANPYADGKQWSSILNPGAYQATGQGGEIYNISVDETQILWVYNKRIFKEAGVEPPATWDELVSICETIKTTTGIDPVGISGNTDSFWNLQFSWLLRSYADQYWRDCEPLIVSQPGDYNYDEEINGDYELSLEGASQNYVINDVRFLKGIRDKTFGPDSDKFRALYTNLNKLLPKYATDDFFGASMGDCENKFFRGRVAMTLTTSSYVANYAYLAEKEAENNNILDEIGYFYTPPMSGPEVVVEDVPVSSSATGWFGVVNKDQKQNDLSMDFMMFVFSPETQQKKADWYEEADMTPAGVGCLVENVRLPEKWETLFKDMQRGTFTPESKFTRFLTGLENERISIRESADYAQQYMQGLLDLDEFSKKMDEAIQSALPRVMTINAWREDALEDVTKNPKK